MIISYLDGRVRVYLKGDPSEYKNSVVITGFRGFGMVGYNVSKFLALGLGAKRVGFIVTKPMPPVVMIEEDGEGFPFDIYYSPRAEALIIVNRALPEREHADDYAEAIASFARDLNARFSVLVGGLNASFRPEEEKYGYRHLENEHYKGPELDAPVMEEGLGVMGPLALLYMYMTLFGVGAVIVLPYAVADQIDIDAARRGIEIISEKILGTAVNLRSLEKYAERLEREKEKIMQIIVPMMQQAEQEEEKERKGMYM
ncbi:MAG: PAC2 family protein [Desulfurococcales archaeon]|nr:PAC2 family protein [Desulfurococcales archaeon]